MMNRLWQHHFGLGLVRTTEDLELRGICPSSRVIGLVVGGIHSNWLGHESHAAIDRH